jgi:alpha-tubulin suppressor-like RCC1 family protein
MGWFHSAALTRSGEVYVWGQNEDGKLGLGDFQQRLTPVVHPLLDINGEKIPKLRRIQCAGHNTFFLTECGKLYSCGWNGLYALGVADSEGDQPLPIMIQEDVRWV